MCRQLVLCMDSTEPEADACRSNRPDLHCVAWQVAFPGRRQMQLVDLSRDIYHMMPRLLNHPSIVITTYSTHDEIREAEGVKFSSKTLALAMGDHTGTHVDAPIHFDAAPDAQSIDQVPLENFFTEAVCLDLSHKELKERHIHRGSGTSHRSGRRRGQAERYRPVAYEFFSPMPPGYLTDFPGLTKESAEWLGAKKITSFGVEAVSPGTARQEQFRGPPGLSGYGIYPYGGIGQSREADRQGPVPFHRLSSEDSRWHGQPDSCRCLAGLRCLMANRGG